MKYPFITRKQILREQTETLRNSIQEQHYLGHEYILTSTHLEEILRI